MNYRKSKFYIYMILSIILLFCNLTTVLATTIETPINDQNTSETIEHSLPKAPSVTAESAIIMEASTGLVLYEKNSKAAKYPASITKILTTLLAVENSSLNDTVTFSRDAVFGVDLDSSRIGIDVGEKLSMEDCLYGIMLASANEVSYAVAEHIAGSLEDFVAMMNERAQELGCVNSNFVNPHGLQDENHYTCAYDMALIAREAIRNTTFAKIAGTRTYTIPPTNIQEEARPLANHHKFIKRDYHYDGVIGGKTGYTAAAKYTLVTHAKRGDMELICVVMGSDSVATEYSDTAALLDYGFDNFSIYNISSNENDFFNEDSFLFSNYSSVFNPDNAFLSTGDDGFVVLPNNVSLNDATKKITYNDILEVVEGDNVIGQITYTYQDKVVGQTDIIYRNIQKNSLPTKINTIIESSLSEASSTQKEKNSVLVAILWIATILVALFGFYFIVIDGKRRKRRKAYKRRREAYKRKYSDYDF